MKNLDKIVDLKRYPLSDPQFQSASRSQLNSAGALVLKQFVTPEALATICAESTAQQHTAYSSPQHHNVYLAPPDENFSSDHPRNRLVVSSKECVCDDQISSNSGLRALYDTGLFRDFLCSVLGEDALYPYDDPLSSLNVHYALPGQELGWHFDNSSFAITLMIQAPQSGGAFEYVSNLRDADAGEMNYDGVDQVLTGKTVPERLSMEGGTLVLFRGRNSMHRVAPIEGDRARILAVLAYNSQPGISLSESARVTFYGRLE